MPRDEILDDAHVQYLMACDLLAHILMRHRFENPDYLPWGGQFEKATILYTIPPGNC